MFYLMIFINALFLGFQVHVSTQYQYKQSFLISLIYTMYIPFITPYVTFLFIYWFICIMHWLFTWASYLMRHKLSFED